jgi:hypothetical protein
MRRWWNTLGRGEQIAVLSLLVTIFVGLVGVFPAYIVFFENDSGGASSESTTTVTSTTIATTSSTVIESSTTEKQSAATETFLSDLTPVGGTGGPNPGPVNFSGKPYAHSVFITCGLPVGDTEYNLGSQYSQLDVTVGINDDEQDASGVDADAAFYGNGRHLKTVRVSLGNPRTVHIDVRNIVRLRITCDTGDTTEFIDLALGDAKVSP